MMPPKFSLQNVLEVRHSRVEALEIELGKLQMEQLNIEAQLSTLHDLTVRLMEGLQRSMQGELDMVLLALLRSDLKFVEDTTVKVQTELAQMKLRVETKRRELVAAKQDEEVLQILKRKRLEAYAVEQAEQEARTQDDIYISQAFRNRAQEVQVDNG
jgi:flagellar export protein FliJ